MQLHHTAMGFKGPLSGYTLLCLSLTLCLTTLTVPRTTARPVQGVAEDGVTGTEYSDQAAKRLAALESFRRDFGQGQGADSVQDHAPRDIGLQASESKLPPQDKVDKAAKNALRQPEPQGFEDEGDDIARVNIEGEGKRSDQSDAVGESVDKKAHKSVLRQLRAAWKHQQPVPVLKNAKVPMQFEALKQMFQSKENNHVQMFQSVANHAERQRKQRVSAKKDKAQESISEQDQNPLDAYFVLRDALREGKLSSQSTSATSKTRQQQAEANHHHQPENMVTMVADALNEYQAVVEIGTGQVAFAFARKYGKSMVAVLDSRHRNFMLGTNQLSEMKVAPILCTQTQESLLSTLDLIVSSPQFQVEVLVLSDIDTLAEELVPDELESLVSDLLLVTDNLLILPPITELAKRMLNVWKNGLEGLVKQAAIATHLNVKVVSQLGAVTVEIQGGYRRFAPSACQLVANTLHDLPVTIFHDNETTSTVPLSKLDPINSKNDLACIATLGSTVTYSRVLLLVDVASAVGDADSEHRLLQTAIDRFHTEVDTTVERFKKHQQELLALKKAMELETEKEKEKGGASVSESVVGSHQQKEVATVAPASTAAPPDDGANKDPSVPLTVVVRATEARCLPIHLLVDLGLDRESKPALIRQIIQRFHKSDVAAGLTDKGHRYGDIVVGMQGLGLLYVPDTVFVFKGTQWSHSKQSEGDRFHVGRRPISLEADHHSNGNDDGFDNHNDAANLDLATSLNASLLLSDVIGGGYANTKIDLENLGFNGTSGEPFVSYVRLIVGGTSTFKTVDPRVLNSLAVPARSRLLGEQFVGKIYKPSTLERTVPKSELRTAWSLFDQALGVTLDATSQLSQGFSTSLLAYGQIPTLLAFKLARRIPQSSIVALVPHTNDSTFYTRAQDSVRAMRLSSVTLMPAHLDADTVVTLSQTAQTFHSQMLGREVFDQLGVLETEFPHYLGTMMLLARTTVIEVPPADLLIEALAVLGVDAKETIEERFNGIVAAALAVVNVDQFDIQLLTSDENNLSDAGQQTVGAAFVVVTLHEASRTVVNCKQQQFTLALDPQGDSHLMPHSTRQQHGGQAEQKSYRVPRMPHTVSLQFLLALPLSQRVTQTLLFNFIHTPNITSTNYCPANFVLYGGNMYYHTLVSDWTPSSIDLTVHESVPYWHDASLSNTINSQLKLPFSFVEWGSGAGNVSMDVAAEFPQGTVLSMDFHRERSHAHWNAIKERSLFNNLVSAYSTNYDHAWNFYKSPEMFRYQFLSWRHLRELMRIDAKVFGVDDVGIPSEELARTLGTLISTSVTTFIQLPSPALVSMALMIFFPESRGVAKGADVSFDLKAHPTPAFAMAEQRFIVDHVKTPNEENQEMSLAIKLISPVEARQVSSELSSSKSQKTWSLLRIDLRKMNHEVNHHFQFELDGHQRKYQQHCEATSEDDWKVYIVRKSDGFHIPYETVEALTVISLLRIDLLHEVKDRLYEQLLSLEMYLDMAPWNIAFRAGELFYIDYDTKDRSLTKYMPYAYQLMVALLNLQRTVRDFGHCGADGHTPYGIPFIAHCVNSPSYTGPCSDERLPVACADRTCRATYFDCLKAIQLQDQQVLGASDTLTPLFSKLDIQNQQSIATGDEALLIHFSKASKLSVSAESDGQPLKRIE
eukprot:m.59005 g.59005  ORF g.59005 m.59005 type:complete len:1652 (-) comp11742_c0_seq1:312-5267(-)